MKQNFQEKDRRESKILESLSSDFKKSIINDDLGNLSVFIGHVQHDRGIAAHFIMKRYGSLENFRKAEVQPMKDRLRRRFEVLSSSVMKVDANHWQSEDFIKKIT